MSWRSGFGIEPRYFSARASAFELLELAGDDQDAVIRLIVFLVERAEVVDGHALDVDAAADRRLPVVVPLEGGGVDPLVEDRAGVVLAPLELVADDGHLRGQVLPLDEAVDEPVALHRDAELEVVVGGGHGLEVVGAIDVGGAVEAGPVIAEGLGDLRVVRGPLEDHVLEQVSHARLAITLVTAADEHGHVDGHGRPRCLGEEQHAGPVGQAVLGDPLDRWRLCQRARPMRRSPHRRIHPKMMQRRIGCFLQGIAEQAGL